jgi:hypothetical protein
MGEISRDYIMRAVKMGLREWYTPSRKGFYLLKGLKTPRRFGFRFKMPTVDARFAINAWLDHYITQLSRLQPKYANVLFWRFRDGEMTRWVAHKLHLSMDQVNGIQRDGLNYLVGLIYDEEVWLK